MADVPKVERINPRAKKATTTLSASEALKAAEAAIGESPEKASAKKPAPRKAATSRAVKAARVAKRNPVAVIAATTAVDAPPEPGAAAGGAPSVPDLKPEPVAAPALAASDPVKAEPTDENKPLPAKEGNMTMNDVMETGKKFAEDTKAKLETVYADLNEKAKASVEKSTKAIEELSDIAKGNVEAMVESGKIAAKGFETLGQEAVDYSRKSFEKATASMKSFSTVKTPTEFFQLQSQLLSSSFDDFTKEAAKNSEAMLKLAGEVAQPLTARVTVVTDKVKTIAL